MIRAIYCKYYEERSVLSQISYTTCKILTVSHVFVACTFDRPAARDIVHGGWTDGPLLDTGYLKGSKNVQLLGIAWITLAIRIEENRPYNRY